MIGATVIGNHKIPIDYLTVYNLGIGIIKDDKCIISCNRYYINNFGHYKTNSWWTHLGSVYINCRLRYCCNWSFDCNYGIFRSMTERFNRQKKLKLIIKDQFSQN